MPENGNMDAAPTVAKVFAAASASTNPSAPSKPSDPKFSQFECSDDDSEDDVPLSDLARVSLDDQHVSLKRPRPLSPSVPNEDTILSKRRTASCRVKTCLLWWLTLFNIERVSRPNFYSTSSSSYIVYLSSSSSCQFVLLGNKGAVDLLCVIFWALFSLRRQWQLLRRIDKRSADKCIVFVIVFLCLAVVLPVSIIGDLFRMDVLVRLPVLVFYCDKFVYDIDWGTHIDPEPDDYRYADNNISRTQNIHWSQIAQNSRFLSEPF